MENDSLTKAKISKQLQANRAIKSKRTDQSLKTSKQINHLRHIKSQP